MISTTCPGCAAKFQVPDELVAGKLVRFRCRKCGGTIAVDGAAAASTSSAASSAPSPDTAARTARKQTLMMGAPAEKAPPRPEVPGTMLHGVPLGGTPSESADLVPLSKSEMQAALGTARPPEKVEVPQVHAPKPEPAPKFDLERTPPPSAATDSWEVPPEPPAIKPAEPAAKATTPKPAQAKAAEPEPKATTPKPAEAKAARPAATKVADSKPPEAPKKAAAPADKPALATSASKDKKAETPKPAAAKKSDIFGKKGKDDAPAPISPKKQEAAKDEGAKGESPKPPSAMSGGADKRLDGPSSKRSARISMELGGVFNAPSKSEPAAKSDELDVDVELDPIDEKPLELEPIIAKPPKPAPPTPQLKKVVLDLADVGGGDAPESRPMPSVAFFSPVLIPQMQLSQPSAQPLLSAPVEADLPRQEQKAAPMKSGQGMVWAAIIASVGILCAGGYLLWNTLHTSAPQPTRTGASTESPAVTQAPTRVAAPETPATAPKPQESVAAATPPPAETANPPAADTASKTNPTEKKDVPAASTDTGKKVAATQGDPPAATQPPPAPAETKTPDPPSTTPTKQPQPTEANDVPFDKAAAATALGARKAVAAGCKQEGGPTGNAKVSVTFANSGRVTSANINGPPFAGTPVGGCIASKFRGATVPPFTGNPVTVHTTVPIF